MRPLMVAEPMLRAPRPEMVDELKGACSAPIAVLAKQTALKKMKVGKRIRIIWK